MKKINYFFALLGVTVVIQWVNITPAGYAQCGSFMKGKCMPKLKPYISTEQVHNTTLLTNDRTKTSMTFYYGDEYRILICVDEKLGKFEINLRDNSNKVVFTTQSTGSAVWDFNVESTQDLTLEVITPPGNANEKEKSGCVSMIVGFK